VAARCSIQGAIHRALFLEAERQCCRPSLVQPTRGPFQLFNRHGETEAGHPAKHRHNGDLAFKSGQGNPKAAMDSEPE